MYVSENGITRDSYYYIKSPSKDLSKMMLTPTIAGDYTYLPGYSLSRKRYDSYLLLLVLEGDLTVSQRWDRKEITDHLHKDDLILINCYDQHAYHTADGCRAIWCHFLGAGSTHWFRNLGSCGQLKCHMSDARSIESLFRQLLSAMTRSSLDADITSGSLLIELLGRLKAGDQDHPGQDPITTAKEYISKYFCDNISLDDMASKVSLSPYYFSRLFKSRLGVSPYQYLLDVRMSQAKYLLTTGTLPVKQIATLSGFTDESVFCASFKSREGMTPGQYRSNHIQ